jgi:hypothetical protein
VLCETSRELVSASRRLLERLASVTGSPLKRAWPSGPRGRSFGTRFSLVQRIVRGNELPRSGYCYIHGRLRRSLAGHTISLAAAIRVALLCDVSILTVSAACRRGLTVSLQRGHYTDSWIAKVITEVISCTASGLGRAERPSWICPIDA